MGGIDLLNRDIRKYPMTYKTNKRTIRAIFHSVDFAMAAAWLQYRKDAEQQSFQRNDIMDYLDFQFGVTKTSSTAAWGYKNDGGDDQEPSSGTQRVRIADFDKEPNSPKKVHKTTTDAKQTICIFEG